MIVVIIEKMNIEGLMPEKISGGSGINLCVKDLYEIVWVLNKKNVFNVKRNIQKIIITIKPLLFNIFILLNLYNL
jgi:predicted rRNA methylase YqxC with S4 and FtsJ domains